ncbi:MAG: hypothetical protein ABL997_15525 [Planctomycetota bacterium]
MKKPKKKKGMHPAVAGLLFVISATVAARQMFSEKFDAGIAAIGEAITDDPMMVEDEDSGEATENAVVWRDLLAAHGSYDAATSVRLAFAQASEAMALPTPNGESQPLPANAWIGADPPSLPLGVVMVSAASRRAVLGGTVVGIGDTIRNATVVAIDRSQVVLSWNGKILTYDLEDANPREFRAEAQRRLAQKGDAATQTNMDVQATAQREGSK